MNYLGFMVGSVMAVFCTIGAGVALAYKPGQPNWGEALLLAFFALVAAAAAKNYWDREFGPTRKS